MKTTSVSIIDEVIAQFYKCYDIQSGCALWFYHPERFAVYDDFDGPQEKHNTFVKPRTKICNGVPVFWGRTDALNAYDRICENYFIAGMKVPAIALIIFKSTKNEENIQFIWRHELLDSSNTTQHNNDGV